MYTWLEKILAAAISLWERWQERKQLIDLGKKEQEIIEAKKDAKSLETVMEIKDEQAKVANDHPTDRDDLANRLRNTGL